MSDDQTATVDPTSQVRVAQLVTVDRWGERMWWTAAGVVVLLWALDLFSSVDEFSWLSYAVVLIGLWGLGTLVASWLPWRPVNRSAWAEAATWATLGVAVTAFCLWSFAQINASPNYGTDEIAFDQYAAQQYAIHGQNPYVHSMAPALDKFEVSPDGFTFKTDGTVVSSLSYPALAFEIYMPFLWLGWSSQLAVILDVIAWALSIILLFALLPRRVRPIAIVLGSASIYIAYAIGGITDDLFIPLLIGAAYRWTRFASERGPMTWIGPVLLGLAMSIKQTPWLLLPFVCVGLACEVRRQGGDHRRAATTSARYAAIALGTFLVPNLPYIAADTHAWLSGITTPVVSHTVPAGQGLVGLSLFAGVGGGSLQAYAIAAVVVFVALLACYAATYPWLGGWTFLMPSLVLFFAARSYASYLVTLVPAALVAAFTTGSLGAVARDGPAEQANSRSRWTVWQRWRLVVAASGVAVVGAIVYALGSPAPLSVSITGITTTGQLATVSDVQVHVVNTSGAKVHPAFTVEFGGTLTSFWSARGPSSFGPGRAADYTLVSPDEPAQPPITGGFQVVAFTNDPGAVSRSSAYLPNTWHITLTPAAVHRTVPVGQVVVVQAQILDQLDRPVHARAIPVYLGQAIYEQAGLQFGSAVINGGQVGQTPVRALTNADGMAVFRVKAVAATLATAGEPTYFEANLVNGQHFYPYGYSQILLVRFGQ